MPEDIPLLPMAGWDLRTLPGKNVMLTVQFLTGPLDTPETAQSRNFVVSATHARKLGRALLRTAEAAEKRQDRMPGATH